MGQAVWASLRPLLAGWAEGVVAVKPPNGDLSRLMRFFLVEAENPLRPGG